MPLPAFTLPGPVARLGARLPQLPPTLALVGGLIDQQLANDPGGDSRRLLLDRAADMSGPEMLAATATMSPAQIEAWLDRQI